MKYISFLGRWGHSRPGAFKRLQRERGRKEGNLVA
jgi:hypothetical protein